MSKPGQGGGAISVGVIADTHGLLRPEAGDRLAGVDHILHAGDIGGADIVPRLGAIAPVTAIRGNVDIGDWARVFPATVTLDLGGWRVHMLHDVNDLDLDPAERGVDVVVAGHSHRPCARPAGGVLYLYPGSAGRRRFSLPVTLAILELGAGAPRARILDLMEGSG